jgi:two-component system cell cycle response regulator
VSASENQDQGADKPLVLIVDDDLQFQRLAELQLRRDFDLIQASDGRKAVDLALELQPDVIVLDVVMPFMNGKEVLAKLNEREETRDIPVVVFSILGTSDEKIELLDGGAFDFITKPADPGELIARIRGAARVGARNLLARSKAIGNHSKEFDSRLAQEVSRASRSSASLSLLLVATGDGNELPDADTSVRVDNVAQDSAILRTNLRLPDSLFHRGKGEFSVILPDTSMSAAYLVAERCRKALDRANAPKRPSSVGIAEFSPRHSAEELVQKAELALARARDSGGGCWRADDPRRHSVNTLALSEELTEREWNVLHHLAYKRTEYEIAQRLGIRTGTVRSHKARIRRKLQIAPSVRLTDFARNNLHEILAGGGEVTDLGGEAED